MNTMTVQLVFFAVILVVVIVVMFRNGRKR